MSGRLQRAAIRPGDRVVFDDIEHTVLGWSGTSVRLLSEAGEPSVVLLTHLLGAPGFSLLTNQTQAPASPLAGLSVLADVPEQEATRARWWERHVVEVQTGRPPGTSLETPCRPEYDPARHRLAEREQAKAAELTAAGTACSAVTVRRHRYAYARSGLLGLVDQRALRGRSTTGRVDERVVAATRHAITEQTEASTGTRGRLRRRVAALLAAEHGPEVAMPSPATFYRLVARLQAGTHAFGAATSRRSLGRRPARPFGGLRALRPGEWVHIDTSPLDVLAVLDDGVTGRVELTVLVDVATRTICAGILRPAGTKAVDAALLLARAVVPEPMRPGWPEALRMRASRLPHQQLAVVDERIEAAAALPVIVPESIVSDRGAVFLSQTFTDACTRLGISLHPARPGVPTDKPTVERTFSSIHTLFCQYVAGYTGRDVTRRGADVEAEAVWTVPQLQDLFDQWVIAGWQPRPHDGLRVPELPRAVLSPNEMYAALIAAAGYLPLALTDEDYLELLPVAWRRITATGIELDVLTYDSAVLNPLRGQDSGLLAHDGRWPVHHDPYDRGQVWVRHPDGGWLEVPWVYRGMLGVPFAEFTVRHVRAQIAARGERGDDQRQVAAALHGLLDRAGAGPAPQPDPDRRTQRVVARTSAVGSVLPGSTVPPDEQHAGEPPGGAPAAIPNGPADGTEPGATATAESDTESAPDSDDVVDLAAFEVFDPHAEAERIW